MIRDFSLSDIIQGCRMPPNDKTPWRLKFRLNTPKEVAKDIPEGQHKIEGFSFF